MGEDIGSPLRSMSNPNIYGDPDTYLGTNWYTGSGDNGGVHTNSGVLNFWYYLVSEGGVGINDISNSYNVTGIGIDTAGAIAYRTLSVYLTNTSQYIDARFYSIISAIDLYGPCSGPVETVTNAMYAVGVGGPYIDSVDANFTADFTTFCNYPAVVNFTNQSSNGLSYYWDFGDGNNSTAINPSHSYSSLGTFAVKLITFGGACGTDSIIKAAYINIDPANPCTTMIPQTGSSTNTSCFGTLYDSGGLGNYHDNTNSVTTIAPNGAINVILNFTSFNFEAGYDYLHIYDGPNTSSTLMGSYDGNTLPNGGTIVSTGSSITLRQETDQFLNYSGFVLNWSCNYPNAAPFTDFEYSDTLSCNGMIQFFDKSLNGPSNWLWYFGDGDTSSIQNPMHNYISNGTYTVKLVASNSFGIDSIIKSNIITIYRPNVPLSQSLAKCDSASFTLTSGASGTVYWYDDTISSNFIDTGNIYVTPVLTTTTQYYIENVEVSPPIYGGKSSNSGGGGYFTFSSSHYLVFDCFMPSLLKSVLVYAGTSGNRVIELRNNLGNVLLTKTINIPSGSSRINLDFNIPVGTGYQLAGPVNADLYRNNNGTNYPYAIGNLINITHSSATSNPTAYYYFFYDWEVQKPACISPRIPITAFVHYDDPIANFTNSNTDPTVNFYDGSTNAAFYHWDFGDGDTSNMQNPSHTYTSNGTFTVKLTAINACGTDTISKTVTIGSTGIETLAGLDKISIYPNPTEGCFTISFSSLKQQNIELDITDILGKIIQKESLNLSEGNYSKSIDISSLAKGMYII
ncbi:PKD domain-containing protein, partial [candidate division KSB1 bacterium]